MATPLPSQPEFSRLQVLYDPELQRRVNALRRPDNGTNWFYLAREYLFLCSAAGLVIAFYLGRAGWDLSVWWDVPVTLLGILLMGIGQHRLVMLGHEASHYALFRNRLLNDLASDWLCMFPLFSVTHNYRLQHMPHHQYTNDPERDPDLVFMQATGHHLTVPVSPRRFLYRHVLRKLVWLPGLVRYVRVRARHLATSGVFPGSERAEGRGSKLLYRIAAGYLLALIAALTALVLWGGPWSLALVPPAMLAGVLTFYALVPDRMYPRPAIRPIVSPRSWTFGRLTYFTLLFSALAWLTYLTGAPWALYYLLLWVVPLVTTFAFFMILREELQHGDAGRGRFQDTRNFEGNPLIRFAVFPMGMGYHLPHHLFPMVPHYHLQQLHTLLQSTEVYSRQAAGVEQIFHTE
ncbi:MAG: fatty acid desaturase [Planctomycetes bacterium]|nr:fatty acid desaturase [Planctomycetota bacterium]